MEDKPLQPLDANGKPVKTAKAAPAAPEESEFSLEPAEDGQTADAPSPSLEKEKAGESAENEGDSRKHDASR